MRASVGDRILISGLHLGESRRDGEILEVHGPGGEPPFVVRWFDTGHVTTCFPGPDATIQHLASSGVGDPE